MKPGFLPGVLSALLIFHALKKKVGIRVTVEEEFEGMDLVEHGMPAYSGLVASPLYDVEETPHHGVPEFKGQGLMATMPPVDYQK